MLLNNIEILFNRCKSPLKNEHFESLSDLGHLIERYKIANDSSSDAIDFLYDKSVANITLNSEDIIKIEYFLFYLIANFPDRSSQAAWCLTKCFDSDIQIGLCQLTKAYIIDNNDETILQLLYAIGDINSDIENINPSFITLLFDVIKTENVKARNYALECIALYKKHKNVLSHDIRELLMSL